MGCEGDFQTMFRESFKQAKKGTGDVSLQPQIAIRNIDLFNGAVQPVGVEGTTRGPTAVYDL